MWRTLWLVLALPALSLAGTPTVIVDVQKAGANELQRLRSTEGVQWQAEFGTELLLGVSDESLSDWLDRPGVRPGPPSLLPEEIVVRDHVCTLHDAEPAIAVIGGYEILRKPPSLARATRGPQITGEPLPADGVVARAAANLGQPIVAGPVDPAVLALTQRVDSQRWFDTVVDLAGFDRNSFSTELDSAHDWILDQFSRLGMSTDSFPFALSGALCMPVRPDASLHNPIGIKRGARLPDEWVVVGAHYDSRNSVRCDTANVQPGANDNGSGCAGVIEMARVLSQVDTERSVLLTCFAGEEQGLVGSQRYVESLQLSGDIARVRYMINLDMLGFAEDDNLSARIETIPAFASETARFAAAAATYAPEISPVLSSSTQAYSDHWYFLQAGIPGVFTWENGAAIYPHYHRATDTPANLTRGRELATGILRMDLAILAEEAGLMSDLLRDGFE
ncbi:MAG: M28 family peptidase [Xanthomonadales bacterium]|nr:M28 family peptidase [Xanthomonadales bacterium]